MEKNLVNYNLDIPFKEFMAGQIIDPVQFNDDMAEIEEKVNEIIGKHNSLNNSAREHIANKDNPHEVTAHQVGTYTGEEIDGFVNEIKDGGLNPKSIKNEVLADNCVDSRTIANHTITASKVDSLFGGQIDISKNTEITDRYTKTEVDTLIKEKVGEGAYSKEEIDNKFQEVQAGQIVDKTIGVDKLKDDVGTLLDISANKSITDRYTKEEVDVLVRENGLPIDWGGLEEIVEKQHYGHLPVANVMTADEFIAPSIPVLDIDVREVVGARGGYDNLGKRLNSIDSQLEQNKNNIKSIFINVCYPPNGFEKVVDDGTDQHSKIQKLIDYIFEQGGGTLYFPSGTYISNLPLILPSEYTKRVVNIKGCDRNNTIIKKENNNTLDGDYSGIDSVIILHGEGDNIGYNKIEDITISGRWLWSEDNNHQQTEYGIYSSKNTSFVELKRIKVSANKTIYFNGALWQSYLHDLMLYGWTRGIHLNSTSSTSNLIDKSYVMNCRGENAIAYFLTGNYSHGNNLACDNGGGILYNFRYADWTIAGIGCEVMDNTKVVVRVEDKSSVTIINPTFYTPTKENGKVFDVYSNSYLKVVGGSIGDKHNPKTNPSKLISLGYTNSIIDIDTTRIYDTLNESSKVEDTSCHAYLNGVDIFSKILTLDGNLTWGESSKGSTHTNWRTVVAQPSNVIWGHISTKPSIEVLESPEYISPAPNKPLTYSNITLHNGGEVYLTLSNTIAPNLETLKSLLNSNPVKIKLLSK